jgi:hypothetical protein
MFFSQKIVEDTQVFFKHLFVHQISKKIYHAIYMVFIWFLLKKFVVLIHELTQRIVQTNILSFSKNHEEQTLTKKV